MKKIILIITLNILSISLFAQQSILKGKLVDETGLPLAFANVMLLKSDSIQVQITLTDSTGFFLLREKNGSYILKIHQFGQMLFTKNMVLDQDVDLGTIKIETVVALSGVNIQGRKKLVEQKVDRLVFNVENSIASQGMSGLDALRNTPLVQVQNENLSIVGKGNVAVMVNDRILNLSGSELTNYLQALRSDDILRIEVITTPPAKYGAQGNSGLINIILKRNPNLGWSGAVNASYQRNSYNGFRTGVTINYQSKKISSSLKLSQGNINYKLNGTSDLIGDKTSIFTTESRKDNPRIYGVNYGLDYKINERQNIGFIYDFSKLYYDITAAGISRYEANSERDSTLITNQQQHWLTPTHVLNTYYDLKLDSTGKKLSITGNYLSNAPDKVNDFSTFNSTSNYGSIIRNDSKMDYAIFSTQADLTLPSKFINIETGISYSLLDNKSDVGYYDLKGSDYIINPNNSNLFNYKEHNFASYLSLQKDFSKKWSTNAGLRYEYTSLTGFTPRNEINKIKRNYGKLFPTVYISYKPDENHSLALSYSKRINRPGFQSLNPFRWYTNTYMYATGNSTLQPSFNDNVELSYAYKGKLTFGIYNQYSQDNIANIARYDEGIYSSIIENGYDQNRTGINIGYYDTFFQVWETSLSANASYTQTSPTILELEKLKVYSLYYAANNTIRLNKNKTYFLLLNFSHSLPFTYSSIKLQKQIDFSPGVRASFFDKKLNMSAVVSDAFKTLKNNGYSYNGQYKAVFTQYNDYRRILLSATYSFGNNKIKGANKNVKFEEQSRAN